ncbi:MAG: DUF4416 family protein [Candidatus Omnitrophota bacterium]
MGKIQSLQPVKLISGFIFKDELIYKKTKGILERQYGSIDFESQAIDFIHTDFYKSEIGTNLKRKFISFKKLIPPNHLSSVKTFANKIEKKFSSNNKRAVNIDPGYLDLSKMVLATTKDFTHRIYLDKGIFAEVTLFFQGKSYKCWPWTYPDYQTPEHIAIFNIIRELFRQQLTR